MDPHDLGTVALAFVSERHLATLTRNRIVFDGGASVDKLATPTPTQRRAFELIGAPIPLVLK